MNKNKPTNKQTNKQLDDIKMLYIRQEGRMRTRARKNARGHSHVIDNRTAYRIVLCVNMLALQGCRYSNRLATVSIPPTRIDCP